MEQPLNLHCANKDVIDIKGTLSVLWTMSGVDEQNIAGERMPLLVFLPDGFGFLDVHVIENQHISFTNFWQFSNEDISPPRCSQRVFCLVSPILIHIASNA